MRLTTNLHGNWDEAKQDLTLRGDPNEIEHGLSITFVAGPVDEFTLNLFNLSPTTAEALNSIALMSENQRALALPSLRVVLAAGGGEEEE